MGIVFKMLLLQYFAGPFIDFFPNKYFSCDLYFFLTFVVSHEESQFIVMI